MIFTIIFFWKSAFEPRRNVARAFEVKSKFSKPINEIVHIRDIIPFSPYISDMFCYHGINFLSDLFGKEKGLTLLCYHFMTDKIASY